MSKSENGTGLGLFISKSIAEAHGGKVSGENNKDGKGAMFTFTLRSNMTLLLLAVQLMAKLYSPSLSGASACLQCKPKLPCRKGKYDYRNAHLSIRRRADVYLLDLSVIAIYTNTESIK